MYFFTWMQEKRESELKILWMETRGIPIHKSMSSKVIECVMLFSLVFFLIPWNSDFTKRNLEKD